MLVTRLNTPKCVHTFCKYEHGISKVTENNLFIRFKIIRGFSVFFLSLLLHNSNKCIIRKFIVLIKMSSK